MQNKPPVLTAEFPDDEPPRREPPKEPEIANDFEAASFTDHQAEQDIAHVQMLESQRDKPRPQGMDYTIGGSIEQEVHENVAQEREEQIQALKQRIERQRGRGRGRE